MSLRRKTGRSPGEEGPEGLPPSTSMRRVSRMMMIRWGAPDIFVLKTSAFRAPHPLGAANKASPLRHAAPSLSGSGEIECGQD